MHIDPIINDQYLVVLTPVTRLLHYISSFPTQPVSIDIEWRMSTNIESELHWHICVYSTTCSVGTRWWHRWNWNENWRVCKRNSLLREMQCSEEGWKTRKWCDRRFDNEEDLFLWIWNGRNIYQWKLDYNIHQTGHVFLLPLCIVSSYASHLRWKWSR